MASYDLTPSMAPFFDVHMVGPLLDFLREVNNTNDDDNTAVVNYYYSYYIHYPSFMHIYRWSYMSQNSSQSKKSKCC